MKVKRIIGLLMSILFILSAIAGIVYAWFLSGNNNIILITGDIALKVKGYCKILSIDEFDGEILFEESDLLLDLNKTDNLQSNQFIAFKFEITNLSDKDVLLSMRFSSLSEEIFENFSIEINPSDLTLAGSDIYNKMTLSAQANTAKLSYNLDDIKYEYPYGTETVLPTYETQSLWRYSAGQYIFEKIPLKHKTDDLATVCLYFTLKKTQASFDIENYANWLCNYDGISDPIGNNLGYGQRVCAIMLNSTWDALSAGNKSLINSYLHAFINHEIKALKPNEDEVPFVNLNLKYFEIIAI